MMFCRQVRGVQEGTSVISDGGENQGYFERRKVRELFAMLLFGGSL